MPATRHTFIYRTIGALDLKADVYLGPAAHRASVVVWMHGGALISGHRGGISEGHVGRLTDAGHTVVSIDYRLAPETRVDGILKDVLAAFAWVRRDGPELFDCDPERVAAMGSSPPPCSRQRSCCSLGRLRALQPATSRAVPTRERAEPGSSPRNSDLHSPTGLPGALGFSTRPRHPYRRSATARRLSC